MREARSARRLTASLLAAFALVGAAWSCSFPDVDLLGKACEGSCGPYLCVDRVCVASLPDAQVVPADGPVTTDAGAADASGGGPCVPKPALDGGTIVFRDCFDDREPAQAVGLGTPWPNADLATLDPSAYVSVPQSLLFRSGGLPRSVGTGPVMRGGAPAKQLACTFWVRFDELVGTMSFFELRTLLAAGGKTFAEDEALALSATPLGQGLTWRARYDLSPGDAGSFPVTDTASSSPRTEWTKVSVAMSPGSVVVRVGDLTQTISGRTSTNITEFSLRVGALIQEGSSDEVIRYDDVICDVTQ